MQTIQGIIWERASDREVVQKKYSSLQAAWETINVFKPGFGLLCPAWG